MMKKKNNLKIISLFNNVHRGICGKYNFKLSKDVGVSCKYDNCYFFLIFL